MSSLEKCLFKSFAHLLIGLFVVLVWSHVSSFIYFEDQTLVQGVIGKYIFLYGWFPFHFAEFLFSSTEDFCFDEVPFVYSFLYIPCSRGHISENIAV